jgi:orotate phosphoribosyltransferase
MEAHNKQKLLELIKEKAVFKGKFTLSSGKESTYYIDLRLVTLSSEGAYLISKVLFDALKNSDIDSIGGLTMGADPIAAAVAVESFSQGKPISAFIVRKEEKKHGKGKQIEGPLAKNSKVAVVDDVATSGESLLKAIDALKKEGHTVVKVLALVDREEGATENIAKAGYKLECLYNKKDLGI